MCSSGLFTWARLVPFPSTPSKAGNVFTTEGQQPHATDLTHRELELLRLIAEGKSNQEIGQELMLSRRAVRRHFSDIYEKIGASGKVARATTVYALRHGVATWTTCSPPNRICTSRQEWVFARIADAHSLSIVYAKGG